MYDSVRSNFISFTTQFEGSIPYMYLDIKGLVTIGIGNLIDPVGLALPLPFVHKSDSTAASQAEITAEWNKVKSTTSLAQQGAKAAASVTSLMLTQASITALVLAKLDSNVATLKQTSAFASFDTWPADAQLGLLSMAWALGPAFAPGWPTFTAAVARGDWAAAAANCQISTAGNPGVAPRNAADVKLFTNAAAVKAAGSDPSVLWYPKTAPSTGSGGTTGGTPGSSQTGGTGTSTQPTGAGGSSAGGSTDTSGTGTTGTDTSGTDSSTTDTSGTDTSTTDTSSTDSSGSADAGATDPSGTDSSGTDTSGTDSTGADPGATDPSGTDPSGTDPSGTDPSGTDTSGAADGSTTDTSTTDTSGTDTSTTDTSSTDSTNTSGTSGATDGSDGSATDSGGSTDGSGDGSSSSDPSSTTADVGSGG